MLPSSFSTERDFVNGLGDHLRALHKPFAGAHFRVAFMRENGLRFLTDCVIFQNHHTPARAEVDQEKIGGHEIKNVFPQSTAWIPREL